MRRVTNGDYTLVIPLLEDILLQWHQDRRDLVVQDLLELQAWSNVVVLVLCENLPLVLIRIVGDFIAIGRFRELEKEEPVDTP